MSKFAVILAAAGKSSRFGDPHTKKVYAKIGSKPIWMYSAEKFSGRSDVAQMLIVIAEEDRELFNEKYAGNAAMLGIEAVIGGQERAQSVLNALEQVRSDIPMVAIHDAARPCLSETWIDRVFASALKTGATILASPNSASLKRVDAQGLIEANVDRKNVWLAQTPQAFRTELLKEAYRSSENASSATDEATLLHELGHPVSVVEGSPLNIKVTTQADLQFVSAALNALPKRDVFPFS